MFYCPEAEGIEGLSAGLNGAKLGAVWDVFAPEAGGAIGLSLGFRICLASYGPKWPRKPSPGFTRVYPG
jgi:hypothetical protein